MNQVYLCRSELLEINKAGELVKSDIEIPSKTELTTVCNNIIAVKNVEDDLHIYELIDRNFVLKYDVKNYMQWPAIRKLRKDNKCCVQVYGNFLSIMVKDLSLYVIYDLDNPNCSHEEFLTFFASTPVYCDGIISYAPFCSQKSNRYYNIHVSTKAVTNDCPYFMKVSDKLKVENNCNFSSTILIIGNEHYDLITGQLLFTGTRHTYIDIYTNNFIGTHEKMVIAPGAPIKEYKYNDTFVYIKECKEGKKNSHS